jgi:hypothetical protein
MPDILPELPGIYAVICLALICLTIIIIVCVAIRGSESKHRGDIMRGIAEIFRWWRRPGT